MWSGAWRCRPPGQLRRQPADGQASQVRGQYVIAAGGGRTVADLLGVAMVGPTDLVDTVSAHVAGDLSTVLPDDSCRINWFVDPDLGGSIGQRLPVPPGRQLSGRCTMSDVAGNAPEDGRLPAGVCHDGEEHP